MGRMKFILLLSAVAAANALVLDRTGTGSGASCITNDGPAAGSACVFPFNFWGVSHFTCTTIDGDSPWCSTQTDVNDNHVYGVGAWGYCDASCPMEDTTTTTTTTTCQVVYVLENIIQNYSLLTLLLFSVRCEGKFYQQPYRWWPRD